MSDLISRQAAIDAMAELQGRASTKAELKGISKAWKRIKQLPSAQTDVTDINVGDTISRKAAIEVADAIWSVTGDKNVAKVWDQLKDLPSAQPEKETCKDCKWEDSFGYGECHHCKRRFEDMWEGKDNE